MNNENNKLPFFSIKIKNADNYLEETTLIKTIENFDADVMGEIYKIAKENNIDNLFLLNKEFIVEALIREVERRKQNGLSVMR
jgi:hypothetical protein